MKEIILASASPRRRTLLKTAGIDFSVITADYEEIMPENVSPSELVMLFAEGKARAVADMHRDSVVIGSDTVVANGNKILGKPHDKKDAVRMLSELSGKTHSVFTGVSIISDEKAETFVSETKVKFYRLTTEEIEDYVATGEPMDKAGAYGIQGKGSLLVEKIDGDYFTVVGLPVAKTVRVLKKYL